MDRRDPRLRVGDGALRVLHLGASLGPVSGTIVVTWVLTTLAAFVLGVRSLRPSARGRGLAILALSCVSLSALAVMYTGFAFATGIDPVGACGGG